MGTELTTNGIENDFTFGSKYFSLCVSILQNTSRNGMGLRLAYFQSQYHWRSRYRVQNTTIFTAVLNYLIDNSASANSEVSNLTVPHEPSGETHSQPTGIQGEVLALCQPIHYRGVCILDCIAWYGDRSWSETRSHGTETELTCSNTSASVRSVVAVDVAMQITVIPNTGRWPNYKSPSIVHKRIHTF